MVEGGEKALGELLGLEGKPDDAIPGLAHRRDDSFVINPTECIGDLDGCRRSTSANGRLPQNVEIDWKIEMVRHAPELIVLENQRP